MLKTRQNIISTHLPNISDISGVQSPKDTEDNIQPQPTHRAAIWHAIQNEEYF